MFQHAVQYVSKGGGRGPVGQYLDTLCVPKFILPTIHKCPLSIAMTTLEYNLKIERGTEPEEASANAGCLSGSTKIVGKGLRVTSIPRE